jgi:hypothetical protein
MKACVRKVAPAFNRCVIFSTTDFSYHGHPEPLACPVGVTRKSLALYYYSNGRPPEELSAEHGTLVRPRPGETIDELSVRPPAVALRALARRLLPARVADALKGMRRG